MKKPHSLVNCRLSTGISGLDEILKGGLIPNRSYLIVGSTGAGNTILSLQWLISGSQKSNKGLFISLAEPKNEIEQNASSFGWNLAMEQFGTLEFTEVGISYIADNIILLRYSEYAGQVIHIN